MEVSKWEERKQKGCSEEGRIQRREEGPWKGWGGGQGTGREVRGSISWVNLSPNTNKIIKYFLARYLKGLLTTETQINLI